MPDNAPIPTINSISIEGEDYQIEDTVARARADALALSIYEVGDLYFSMNPTSPAARFGGEWEQIEDMFIRAANDTETGGSDTIALTKAQMPEHDHAIYSAMTGGSIPGLGLNRGNSNYDNYAGAGILPSGNSEPHSNMPAYQNVYVWQRVA